MAVRYRPHVAINPQGDLITDLAGATVTIVAAGTTTPLPISEDSDGAIPIAGSQLTVTSQGIIPGFWVQDDTAEADAVSGPYRVAVDSLTGVKELALDSVKRTEVGSTVETPAGAQAKADAAEAEAKTYAGTLAYGTNLEATDAVVAGFVDDPGSEVTASLSTNYEARTAANLVADYNAPSDGVIDASDAFRAALTDAKLAIRPGGVAGSTDPLGTFVLELPAGDFLVEDIDALLGSEGMTNKARGLVIRGQGSGLTNVIFRPTEAGSLMFNDYWQGIRISGIRFVAATPGCTFMRSYTTHSAQDYIFTDVSWVGWKYGFDLQGSNNNSEYRFFACAASGIEADGAFLYIGTSNTSDQFLNYWFYGFKHWSTSAPLIDAARGGSFHLYGVDVSDFANGEASTYRPIIALRGVTHAQGVCSMSVDGLRVEAKSAYSQLLYCEWPQGAVTMRNVDFTSQSTLYSWDRMAHIRFTNVGGPIIEFSSCMFANSKIRVVPGPNNWGTAHRIVFRDCEFVAATLTPSEAVVYDMSEAGGSTIYPQVVFDGCRGGSHISSASGGSVWDAVVGWNSERLVDMTKRQLSVRGSFGAPWTTAAGVQKINLPVGALITGLRVLLPSGDVTSAVTGATWTLATVEATPVILAVVTATGALYAGVDQFQEISPPYKATTREKATVTITPTGIDQNARNGLVLIEGYW